jgi:fumarate hydratase subunit beta
MKIHLSTPISDEVVRKLKIYDRIEISGNIFTGRDAALPKLVKLIENNRLEEFPADLQGGVVFHTAVSPAGIGPTSSNKHDIERSIPRLSEAGVRLHIGKGSLSPETADALEKNGSLFAVTLPVTALLTSVVKSKRLIAFPEEGIEAMYLLKVENFPAIIAIAHGESIFSKK